MTTPLPALSRSAAFEKVMACQQNLCDAHMCALIDGSSTAQDKIEELQKEFAQLSVQIAMSGEEEIHFPQIQVRLGLPEEICGATVNQKAAKAVGLPVIELKPVSKPKGATVHKCSKRNFQRSNQSRDYKSYKTPIIELKPVGKPKGVVATSVARKLSIR
jgi:hypothetical protein